MPTPVVFPPESRIPFPTREWIPSGSLWRKSSHEQCAMPLEALCIFWDLEIGNIFSWVKDEKFCFLGNDWNIFSCNDDRLMFSRGTLSKIIFPGRVIELRRSLKSVDFPAPEIPTMPTFSRGISNEKMIEHLFPRYEKANISKISFSNVQENDFCPRIFHNGRYIQHLFIRKIAIFAVAKSSL